jgi:RNA polymerase sigma factor (sigma-70 family)
MRMSCHRPFRTAVGTMRDDPSVVALVDRCTRRDESEWKHLVQRYAPLVWSVCRRHGVTGTDADDVGGVVWLRLVAKVATIREPAALPGWLATTTRRACLALLRGRYRQDSIPIDDLQIPDKGESLDAGLLAAERRIALRDAIDVLSDRDRRLLSMLFADPPWSYAEISATLGMPVGAIGPTRQRCLERLRRSPSLAALGPDGRRTPADRDIAQNRVAGSTGSGSGSASRPGTSARTSLWNRRASAGATLLSGVCTKTVGDRPSRSQPATTAVHGCQPWTVSSTESRPR